MNLETDTYVGISRKLCNGMIVLTADIDLRLDTENFEKESSWMKKLILKRNRWAKVSDVEQSAYGDTTKFMATYFDGTQQKRHVEGLDIWLAKKNSIPEDFEVDKNSMRWFLEHEGFSHTEISIAISGKRRQEKTIYVHAISARESAKKPAPPNLLAIFVDKHRDAFSERNGVTLDRAYGLYEEFCDAKLFKVGYSRPVFREELKSYFRIFKPRIMIRGVNSRNFYLGFIPPNEHL